VLPEPTPRVDEGSDLALPGEHRAGRGDEEAPVRVADVLRDADHAVGVVTGEVRADEVARHLRRHVGVRAHASDDGDDELTEGIGRAEDGHRRIGHEPGPPFGRG